MYTVASGSASPMIPILIGNYTYFTVTCTAETTSYTRSYSFSVLRAPAPTPVPTPAPTPPAELQFRIRQAHLASFIYSPDWTFAL